MRLAERGAYCDLLFYQWEMGSLPASHEALLRLLGCSSQEFKRIWPALAPKFVVDGDRMHNTRLEAHRSKSKQLKSDKSLAGKAGGIKSGEARRSKRKADPQAASLGSASPFASSKTPSKSEAPSPSPSLSDQNPIKSSTHTSGVSSSVRAESDQGSVCGTFKKIGGEASRRNGPHGPIPGVDEVMDQLRREHGRAGK